MLINGVLTFVMKKFIYSLPKKIHGFHDNCDIFNFYISSYCHTEF